MNYEIKDSKTQKYIYVFPHQSAIKDIDSVMDLIGIVFSEKIHKILIDEGNFTKDFFDLKTGLNGEFSQKLSNYRIIVSAVAKENEMTDRFKEYALETNKGNLFRMFEDIEAATNWIE